MKLARYFIIALIVIVVDQTCKLLVYNSMQIHEEVNVMGQWFRLHYLLNPGMAFGIRWENEFGKLALTVFRIGAMAGIGYYLMRSIKREAHTGFLICLSLILGGAIGNVIDSTFYGVFLDNAPLGSPTKWFHGQVIDMLFFPIFEFSWPDWMPMVGGDYFLFFSPVFNIADSSIFVGVVSILIFQRRFFPHHGDLDASEPVPTDITNVNTENSPSVVVTEATDPAPDGGNNSASTSV
ncbi:MAG TPA: lipoprotein signal peptidase [Cyclobacteriaceae bacterium]|jgi:signal peptidase II|nr:lipoprotein signal peptidase [Cyclobacteriaceae bacterium]